MAFILEGYNTETTSDASKVTSASQQELSDMELFEKKEERTHNALEKQSTDVNALSKQNEDLQKQNEYLQKQLEELKNGKTAEKNVKFEEKKEKLMKAVLEKADSLEMGAVLEPEDVPKQKEPVQQPVPPSPPKKTDDLGSELKEAATDIVESTFEVLGDLGGSLQQFSGATSKLKQAACVAWSMKQDNEIARKFKKAAKVTAGDYTFKVLLDKKEIMVHSYQGPDTILKMPSVIKDMKVTAINPEFLLFRTPKALLNSVKGDTIGMDLSALKQCMICVKQLRLPEHLKYLPSGLFSSCSSLEAVVIPKEVLGVSCMFLEGAVIKHLVFEGKCPSGMRHVDFPEYTKISCRKEFWDSFKGLPNLSVM